MNKIAKLFKNTTAKILGYIDDNKESWINDYLPNCLDKNLYTKTTKQGKNLFLLKDQEITQNGITVTVKDQLITISGKPLTTTSHNFIKLEFEKLPEVLNGTYVLSSYNCVNATSACQSKTGIRVLDSEGGTLFTKTSSYNNAGTVMTFDNVSGYSIVLLVQAAYVYDSEWSLNYQLEKSSQRTSYEKAYIEYSKLIKGGDTFDEMVAVYSGTNENPLESLISDGGFLSCFEKVVCIGDSLTNGNCNYKGDTSGEVTIDYTSYPKNIERICRNTVYKLAFGGATASNSSTAVAGNHSWIDKELTELSTNIGNAYIIALGTNDIGYYNEFTGEIANINTEDMSQTDTTTSVGGYGYIIQNILSVQPKAKIFCITLPKTRNTADTRATANAKIKQIAELLGCYVIDLETYRKIDYTKLYNGGHLNALGYNILAREIITYIDWIIRNNMDDFNSIQFIGTDYSY